jgi:hypothetical protein
VNVLNKQSRIAGQPTKGGRSACVLCEVLTILRLLKVASLRNIHRQSLGPELTLKYDLINERGTWDFVL